MAYPNVWLHVLDRVADLIQKPIGTGGAENYAAVATGAHDVLFTNRYIRKYGIRTISKSDMSAHMSNDRVDYYRSSKELAAQTLKYYGYNSYLDIDNYDRADIVCDLSRPISPEFIQKYDLVLDITSTYVTNIIQSYTNTSKMTKIGGYKIVVTTIGDHTNRFDLNPSPNFLIDFHSNNGFKLERAFVINPKGTTLPYRRYSTKATPIYVLLPYWDFFITLVKTINTIRRIRSVIRSGESFLYSSCQGNREIIPNDSKAPVISVEAQPGAKTAPTGVRGKFKNFLRTVLGERRFMIIIHINRKLRYRRRAFFHDNLSHEWYAYLIFRKVDEVEDINIHITSHYKSLNQTDPSEA